MIDLDRGLLHQLLRHIFGHLLARNVQSKGTKNRVPQFTDGYFALAAGYIGDTLNRRAHSRKCRDESHPVQGRDLIEFVRRLGHSKFSRGFSKLGSASTVRVNTPNIL